MKRLSLLLLVLVLLGGALFFIKAKPGQPTPRVKASLPVDLSGYVNYSDANLETAKLKGKSVLFFAATAWCQTCIGLEKEIIARSSQIPADVTILKVDYDNDKAMKQKYAVVYQHTLVFLDQNGQELTRSAGDDFDQLLARL